MIKIAKRKILNTPSTHGKRGIKMANKICFDYTGPPRDVLLRRTCVVETRFISHLYTFFTVSKECLIFFNYL